MTTASKFDDKIRFFAYGSLLPGELHGDALQGAAHIGPARTARGYRLVELGQFPALIAGGEMQIEGELYLVSRAQRFRLDELKENGRVFFRRVIQLEGGEQAEAYLMDEDKLRGRRRLRATDWRKRFERQIGGSSRRDPYAGIKGPGLRR